MNRRITKKAVDACESVLGNGKPKKPQRAPDDDGRPVIKIVTDEHQVNDQAVKALTADPTVYQRGGNLVHVVREPEQATPGIKRPQGAPRIAGLPLAVLRDRLTAMAKWSGFDGRTDDWVAKHPPTWCVASVHARGQWPGMRRLDGVIDFPVLRPDGTVLAEAGYDARTGLIYAPGIDVPAVAAAPHADEVSDAVGLLREVVSDFPWDKPVHESAWLAGLLTVLSRHAFHGPAPLFLVNANTPGSGKGLLVDVTALILTGRPMPLMAAPSDDEETRKCVTSIATAGDLLVSLDDVSYLSSNVLCAALTATVWRDRILGRNEMTAELPLRVTWWATGNNVELVGDIVRRVCPIQLESPEEHPEDRQGFVHADLRSWVLERRGRLLAAAMTILRGYCAAGRPDMKLPAWGSFEAWSGLVRSALVYANLPDPIGARVDVRERNSATGLLQALFAWWNAANPLNEVLSAAEILRRLDTRPPASGTFQQPALDAPTQVLRDALVSTIPTKGKNGDLPTAGQLGKKLKQLEKRVCNRRRLIGSPVQGTMRFRIETL